ncbi:phosphate ABC transporter membrane protein 1, PhoT family [Raineyella antarctica]|uniref:Phosphate transport system permease protein n=1 Tax=Raineyella antarctica TaxID=1577474 RepID=A0A1G6GE09_9ACTN|nr:phosphate ABC transporter permease subunit PstC [Raineyella antarctica]SDB80252.1 phosphate ABC transporter membrane protein 1, PhoT family [Raineyella antarctica]
MSETTVTPPETRNKLTGGGSAGRAGDKIFSGLTLAAGILIFVVLAVVSLFLVLEALPAMTAAPDQITSHQSFWSYVAPLVVGTLIASAIALVVATPIAIGVALFISHYAPARISRTVGYVVDLLAAIPSVVYGAWGYLVFGPALVPGYKWLHENLGFIPVFGQPSATGRTLLTASLVLSVMILPIITAQCREIFIQTPSLHQEAALALGATKWDMIRAAVFPFARNGIISAIMLGLGRALGETMAVTLVLSAGALTPNLIGVGNNTIPAEIALNFPEAFGMRQSELIAAGLILFVITLLVNMLARWIVSRYSEFSGAN